MKKWMILFLSFFLFPSLTFAYSNEVILGGENIGIHIDTPGVLVVGFYKVNGKYLRGYPEITLGDYIVEVEGQPIYSIDDLTLKIEKQMEINPTVVFTLKRNNDIYKTAITLEKIDGIYKTGLYVKDGITGLGTLSYIDPQTKIYGALGHEIIESKSNSLVEVRTGIIFESSVTSIRKSTNGFAGEKNARFNFEHVYGTIEENTNHGIYGIYEQEVSGNTIPVGTKDDIQLGEAAIYTVLNGSVKEKYAIQITKIQENNDVKNITFEITDENLIQKTGGVIQGMSGSPIVQNNRLIGAVTHVVVDHPYMGYGIFITTMLETGDKLKAES